MRYFIIVFALMLIHPAQSQPVSQGQAGDSLATQIATAHFLQTVRLQKEIYNGPEHIEYAPTIEGFAYFITKDWLPGTVQSDGITYSNEQLKYDMAKDRLIVKRPDDFAVETRSEKTSWFSLPGHLFIYLPAGKDGLHEGFYDQLASGNLTLLAKREKKYEERADQSKLLQRFVEKTTYYAITSGKAHTVKNLHSLLDLMDKRGNQIQQQLRKQGIKWRRAREAALTAAAEAFNKSNP